MAAHYTEQELAEIVRLKDIEGKTHKQIAIILGRYDKKGEPNARSVMTQYKKAKAAGVPAQVKAQLADATSSTVEENEVVQEDSPNISKEAPDQLNELSRKQRVEYLKKRMNVSARSRMTFDSILGEEEKELFLEEYFSVVNEEESLTSAEEQQLFQAILHLTLAMRAAKQDRECYMKSPISGYKGADAVGYVDMFKRDYHDNMKKYNDAMKSLKLSREQRLKDLQRHGTTFLDFAEKYAKTDEQAQAAEEIMRLEEMSQEELVRLQANGWLIAGGLPNNNDVSFAGDRTKKNEESRSTNDSEESDSERADAE